MVILLCFFGSHDVNHDSDGRAGPRAHLNTFFSELVRLIPCRASVSPFSLIPPTQTCCNAIKTLGHPCLCVLGPPISGVDRSMTLQLPEKCAPILIHEFSIGQNWKHS
ncbi:hypothetical protein SOVF_077190 [Spinacia oleracea]|nr:hypothetical protein SOVF_077190 [Spinacia oleracea]